MKIIIFFRSKERSNDICSATKHQLTQSKVTDFVNLDFVNLDKRNIQKLFTKEDFILPNKVYFWHDEEINMDYIKDNFPTIQIETYDNKEREKRFGHYGNEYKYVLADKIINECNDASGFIEFYEVSILNGTVKKSKMTNYDYNKSNNKKNHFQSKEEAVEYMKKELNNSILSCEEDIKFNQERIKKYKEFLKKIDKPVKSKK